MPIHVTCPGCGKSINAPDHAAGRTGTCNDCGTSIAIPETTTPDAEAVVPSFSTPPPLPPQAPSSQPCPFCREPILLGARKCKHCGEILDPDLRRREAADRMVESMGSPSPIFGRQSGAGVFALIMVAISSVWILGAITVSTRVAERSQNDEASVFHQIYELLSWWAALQLLSLSVALYVLANRLHRNDRDPE